MLTFTTFTGMFFGQFNEITVNPLCFIDSGTDSEDILSGLPEVTANYWEQGKVGDSDPQVPWFPATGHHL